MVDKNVLRHLAKKYPNIKAATEEIVNLSAILSLPKGTEYFLSDIHGENDAFVHMIKSASGVIRAKIEEIFGDELARPERDKLAALVYNAEAEIRRRKESEEDFDQWCKINIIRLILICKNVSSKYTRSRVRKRLPKEYAYIIDELLHTDDEDNKGNYYGQIINTLVECGVAEDFITELANVISSLAVDRLHILGDIWDRGAHSDEVMEFLINYHDVDFQWGNHDVLWMGAAKGNWACISNVIRININYNNFDMLEIGYGINLRPLAVMAEQAYADDPCTHFIPKRLEENKYDPVDDNLAAKMNKAISIIQFKVEGQKIRRHPDYDLEKRMLLDKIDYEKGTVMIGDTEYEMRDKLFPTIDPEDPYRLTPEEEQVLFAMEASFVNSEKLQRHIRFLFSNGALYKVFNGNLMFHGCLPIDENGEFIECTVNGQTHKGRAYMEYLDSEVRRAFFSEDDPNGFTSDLMWYLWLGSKSPLFGKDQMTTFERCFIADKKTHKEHTVPYYRMINDQAVCEKILHEFGCDLPSSKVLNGHVPVKLKDGESPIKGNGKLLIIDGGISKAYQKTTGIAGYTFIFNSRFMALAEHKPYTPLQEDGTQEFHSPVIHTVQVLPKRMLVRDTDQAIEMQQDIEELKALIEAYRAGEMQEYGA